MFQNNYDFLGGKCGFQGLSGFEFDRHAVPRCWHQEMSCDKDVHIKVEDSYECIGKMSYEFSAKVTPVPKDHCLLFTFQHVLILPLDFTCQDWNTSYHLKLSKYFTWLLYISLILFRRSVSIRSFIVLNLHRNCRFHIKRSYSRHIVLIAVVYERIRCDVQSNCKFNGNLIISQNLLLSDRNLRSSIHLYTLTWLLRIPTRN